MNLESAQQSGASRTIDAKLHNKSFRRRFVRYGIVGLNGLILLVVAGVVTFNTQGGGAYATANAFHAGDTAKETAVNPLDQVSSAEIAVNIARASALPESTPIANQADSMNMELAMTPASTNIVAKPQIVSTTLKSKKDIRTYVTVSGDTVSSIAQKFDVTSDSIRWSNNITGDAIKTGVTLYVPPENGIVYTVKSGDTPDSLASKFKASKDEIVAANDAEIAGLKVGDHILIPNGTQPAPVVARVVAASTYAWGYSPVYGANGYDYGYCTWYVANRRAELGRPVPQNLGDAYTWTSRAAAAGIPTGSAPQNGAVAVKHAYAPGHVAVVEQVNSDGSFWISEMNSSGQRSMADPTPTGGWGHVDWKIIPAESVSSWSYIY